MGDFTSKKVHADEAPLLALGGATGSVDSCLLSLLEQQPIRVRCLIRDRLKLRTEIAASTEEVVDGNVIGRQSLDPRLAGASTAYSLVHLVASS